MITLKKIFTIIYVFCVLQWPVLNVDSAAAAASNQVSIGAAGDDQSKDASNSGLLGAIYSKSRQSRCVTCYEDRNRYDDRSRYYGGHSGRSGDDRAGNWYYPRYDRYTDERYRGGEGDYDRYGGGDRYGERYGMGGAGGGARGDRFGYRDDRYDARSTYDRHDTKGYSRYSDRRGSYDRGESRGYGYDNRDRFYGGERGGGDYNRGGGDYNRDRYYDRPRYGASGPSGYGYDRDSYDRYSPRYDFRNYRPWDDTYRGQSGFDNSGRGYYYAKGGQEDRRYLPEPGYKSPGSSPCGALKPNCPYGPQEGGTRVSSGPIDSGTHGMGVSHSIYNANTNQNDSSKGAGAGWSYMREDESDHQPPRGGNANGNSGGGNGSSSSASNRDGNRDRQSPAYGALLDRGSNLIAVEPEKAADNAPEKNEKTQLSPSSADDNANQSVSGQNS